MTDRLPTAEEIAELLVVRVSWVRESTRSGRRRIWSSAAQVRVVLEARPGRSR